MWLFVVGSSHSQIPAAEPQTAPGLQDRLISYRFHRENESYKKNHATGIV